MLNLFRAAALTLLVGGIAGAQQVVMDTRHSADPISLSQNQQARILREVRAFSGLKPCVKSGMKPRVRLLAKGPDRPPIW